MIDEKKVKELKKYWEDKLKEVTIDEDGIGYVIVGGELYSEDYILTKIETLKEILEEK